MLRYSPNTKDKARKLRRNMTDAERKLWKLLRKDQVKGLRFYRQRRIENYIVDFYCPRLKFVVEVDGDRHYLEEAKRKDKTRDKYLCQKGLIVCRIANIDVFKNINGVMQGIHDLVEDLVKKKDRNPP